MRSVECGAIRGISAQRVQRCTTSSAPPYARHKCVQHAALLSAPPTDFTIEVHTCSCTCSVAPPPRVLRDELPDGVISGRHLQHNVKVKSVTSSQSITLQLRRTCSVASSTTGRCAMSFLMASSARDPSLACEVYSEYV
eukprot:TRINITY_DN1280_c0_g3_i2.p1 TRINITY_DN1280_c0_g3~~TRINITY_DN1280_c0_g3_i2.p1  ORF type:complete len:139 (+),score=13.20 TRINITY_DN1280_c0_g3_i2:536-952(+)